jgi:phage terminase large subunit-like protein
MATAAAAKAPAKKAPAKSKPATSKKQTGATKARDYHVPRGAVYDAAKGDRAVAFFEKYLRHMKGRWAGQAFALEPWQADEIVRPLFGTVDGKTGLRWYREGLIGLPRKNGKSELAAGIALYMLVADGEYSAEVYSLAGDRKQASLVYKTAGDMVKASLFRQAVKVYRSVMEVPENGSTYRALSADADLQHGLNPHCAIIDEYHVHRDAEQYEAMRTGTAARLQPLTLVITTAGDRKEGACWDLYERGRSGSDPRMFFYWRGVKAGTDIRDLKAFKQANPASWVTLDFLRDQVASLPEPVFRRLHGNEWYEGGDQQWVPREAWEACIGDITFTADGPVVIGVDAASKRDTTAVCAVQRQPDGKLRSRTWLFAADEHSGFLDYGEVENLVRELASTYNVRRVAFDPFQFVRSAQILDNEGLPVETFPQNDTRMVPASQVLYDAIMQGTLVHDGSPELTEQVMAAGVAETVRGWRLSKRKAHRAIDATIALAIACQLAEWDAQLGDGPRVFII